MILSIPKLLIILAIQLLYLLSLLVEVVFWIGYIFKHSFFKVFDLFKAGSTVKTGVIRCPRGHEVPITGGVYECEECGFTYQGSILQCANPECHAITPYIKCPTCGLSVRNPLRYGRP